MKVNNPVEVFKQKQRDKWLEGWKLDPNNVYVKHIWDGVPLSIIRKTVKQIA